MQRTAALAQVMRAEVTNSGTRKEVRKIKSHYVYSSRSQPGSLVAVIMSMEFADGTDTGRGGYVASEPYRRELSRCAPALRCHKER